MGKFKAFFSAITKAFTKPAPSVPVETQATPRGIRGLFKKVFGKKKQKISEEIKEETESDIIIQNFKSLINEMTSETYTPINHAFNPAHPLTDEGTRSKETSRDWIFEVIQKAISERGAAAVAKSIQDNGEYLQQVVEDLVFAIYDGKYAKWGGGYGTYTIAEMELKHILMGDNN